MRGNEVTVRLADFYPVSRWDLELGGKKWESREDCLCLRVRNLGEPKGLVDTYTGRRYTNESAGVIRLKCFLLTMATPFVHSAASVVNTAYKIAKLVSLSHFWIYKAEECSGLFGETEYNFQARFVDAGSDLLQIVVTPLALLGLELSAIYGLLSPYDGRKLYASFERAIYGNSVLAPCIQPWAEKNRE